MSGAAAAAVKMPSLADLRDAGRRAKERSDAGGDCRRPRVIGLDVPDGAEVGIIPSDLPESRQQAILRRWESSRGYVAIRDAAGGVSRQVVEGFDQPCIVCLRDRMVALELRSERTRKR